MSDIASEILEKHSFHPTDPPHGVRNFDLGALSKKQQRELNKRKMKQRIDNEIYLKAHPEVRGCVSIICRHVMSKKPEQNIHETVGSFFNRPRGDLVEDLLFYFDEIGYSGPAVDKLRTEISESVLITYRNLSSGQETSTATESLSSSSSLTQ